jgi:hypothetical protein
MWRNAIVAIALGALGASPAVVVAQSSQAVPKGTVAFFSSAGGQGCPSGWKEAQYAAGRLILATTNGSKIQISSGAALGDQQVPTHTHTYSGNASVDYKSTASAGGSDKGVGAAGSYGTSGTSEGADTDLPFVQYLVCEFFAGQSGDAMPYASVAFFNLSACPVKWATMDYFDGRFILATPAQGKSGSSTTLAWSGYTDPGHGHTYSGSVSVGSKGFVWGGGANHDIAAPGSQPVSGNLAANTDPVVPFVTLLACQKQQLGEGEGLPLGLTLFVSASTCPDNWGTTPAAPGRFFVGITAAGTQGAAFGGAPMLPNETTRPHAHWVNGSIDISEHDTDLTTTWHNLHLGKKGTWAYTTLSNAGSVSLPYVMLEACTYIGNALNRASH